MPRIRFRVPRWRKATWVLAGVAALGMISNETTIVESAAFATWPLLIVWFLSRPSSKVLVFGPEGQQVSVSEREGRRRVARNDGWTYQPGRPPG